jgi:four helix bundle protein
METKTNLFGLAKSFAIDAINFNNTLVKDKQFTISNQFSRSATSIGANLYEAKFAESKRDFLHKMKIAEKEASETAFWLDILASTSNYTEVQILQGNIEVIQKVLARTIQTLKHNMEKAEATTTGY